MLSYLKEVQAIQGHYSCQGLCVKVPLEARSDRNAYSKVSSEARFIFWSRRALPIRENVDQIAPEDTK